MGFLRVCHGQRLVKPLDHYLSDLVMMEKGTLLRSCEAAKREVWSNGAKNMSLLGRIFHQGILRLFCQKARVSFCDGNTKNCHILLPRTCTYLQHVSLSSQRRNLKSIELPNCPVKRLDPGRRSGSSGSSQLLLAARGIPCFGCSW